MPFHSSLGIRMPGKVTSQLGIQEVRTPKPKTVSPKVIRPSEVTKGSLSPKTKKRVNKAVEPPKAESVESTEEQPAEEVSAEG